MVGPLGSSTVLALHKLPSILNQTIDDLKAAKQADRETIIGQLGQSTITLDPLLERPQGFSNFSFSQWIHRNDTDYKNVILKHMSGSDFSTVAMHGLYDTLVNTDLLGTSHNSLTNRTLKEECGRHIYYPSSLLTLHHFILDTYPYYTPNMPFCGLVIWLQILKENRQSNNQIFWQNITTVISNFLCRDTAKACLSFPVDLPGRQAYSEAIAEYVTEHIIPYSLHQTVTLSGENVVATRTQKQWALGVRDAENMLQRVGFLTDHHSLHEAQKSPLISWLNCWDVVEALTNFMWNGNFLWFFSALHVLSSASFIPLLTTCVRLFL